MILIVTLLTKTRPGQAAVSCGNLDGEGIVLKVSGDPEQGTQDVCVCDVGYYEDQVTDTCKKCSGNGEYQDQQNQSTCNRCGTGRVPKESTVKQYRNGGWVDVVIYKSCQPCHQGWYSSSTNVLYDTNTCWST